MASARNLLDQKTIDLVLLDINLPDGSGLDLLREIKERHPSTGVILLTANDTEMDIVEGLERGADDYITKPFSLAILRARVRAQIRRRETHEMKRFEEGAYRFDFGQQAFFKGTLPVELSKQEQILLRLLVENRGMTMSRELLIDRIWTDRGDYVDENALSVTVKRLRDKLGDEENIRTVYGIGYGWVDPFHELD